jgi:hypothetical protein
MRRREFLIASSLGAAFSAAVAWSAGFPLAAASGVSPASRRVLLSAFTASSADIHAAVYEPRYAIARDFARQHAARGIPAFRADDCMVRLWRGSLARVPLQGEALRIAGTTLYSDFAIARDCARELGLKVLREEWLKAAPVTLVHWLIGTA